MRLGLLGHPVKHSLSPPMHRAAFLFFGIEGTYDLFDIEPQEFESRVSNLIAAGLSGFNATIPHKGAALQLCTEQNRSLEARLVGVANTIRVDSAGELHAHNTDLIGFMNALREFEGGVTHSSSLAIILGAGGAARACILGAILAGYQRVCVIARRFEQSEAICQEIQQSLKAEGIEYHAGLSAAAPAALKSLDEKSKDACLIVNCTPVGLTQDTVPEFIEPLFRRNQSSSRKLFFDTVYKPDLEETPLMRLAGQNDYFVCDGLAMLVEQAAYAFQFWTGRLPPHDLLLSAAKSSLQANSLNN